MIVNSGHFDSVEDVAWEPGQRYLVSVSKDQTSRFHAVWRHPVAGSDRFTWHELGRPQIHGYDMQCVAFVDRFRFVSGGDEKLLRLFACPLVFLANYYRLSGDESVRPFIDAPNTSIAQGASVPALGLSNKAVFDVHADQTKTAVQNTPNLADELYKEVYFNVIELNSKLASQSSIHNSILISKNFQEPPTEEHLLQNTLWPEVQKLYGHGYEMFAVACEPKTGLIASACKATKPEHARILLWQQSNDTSSFKQVGSLGGHELTVVQLKFAHSGRLLLSVSRDRTWKLFERCSTDHDHTTQWTALAGLNTKNAFHTRIVWSCDWSHDDLYFVTTSRDKRVCVWNVEELKQAPTSAKPLVVKHDTGDLWLELADSVTASAFAPGLTTDNRFFSFY